MYNYIDNNLIYNDSKANNNIIGDNQLRYIDEVYLSNNSLSNIKQSLWFNLEESLHITGDNDIHYISFVYDSILPVYNKQTDDWFEQFIKSQEQSINSFVSLARQQSISQCNIVVCLSFSAPLIKETTVTTPLSCVRSAVKKGILRTPLVAVTLKDGDDIPKIFCPCAFKIAKVNAVVVLAL